MVRKKINKIEAGEILDNLIRNKINENEKLKRSTIEFYEMLGVYNFTVVFLLNKLKNIKKENEDAFEVVLDTLNLDNKKREDINTVVDSFPSNVSDREVYATANTLDRVLSLYEKVPYGEMAEKFAEVDIFGDKKEMENIIGRLILAIEKRQN